MASLNASIEKSTKDFEQIKTGFDQITDDAKKITDTLFLMSETAEVQNALIKLWRNFSVGQNPQPLEKIFKDFLDTIKRQFEIFNSKVTQNDVVNMWMLSSLNQYFKIASKEFEERCWVTTRFQFFGKIIDATISPILNSKPFLNDFKEKYEIFTVLVLPPKRFFNYNAGELSDPDWDEYIDINVEAKTKGLTINRHFLSLDFGENADELVKEEFGDESIELKKKEFKDQLNVEYWFSKSQSGKGSELIKRGKDKDNKDTYLKAEGASLEGYTKTPLWRILEEIHCDKACKVIELKIPSFDKNNSDPLLKFNDILWDSTTEKTIDYFAIRERETGSWVLCYRTVYDKTFDFAEIEILYEQSCAHDRWNMVCNNLNRVFLIGKTSSAANDVSRDEELGITISPIGAYINGGEVGNEGE
jgi:hypothetical protein